MGAIAIAALVRELVRTAKADQIGHDHPVTRRRQGPDHLAIEIAPHGLAMDQKHRLGGIGRPSIDIGHPQTRLDL